MVYQLVERNCVHFDYLHYLSSDYAFRSGSDEASRSDVLLAVARSRCGTRGQVMRAAWLALPTKSLNSALVTQRWAAQRAEVSFRRGWWVSATLW
jgi:hypothetical protein